MFARPIQVAIVVIIALGSASTAAYASDAAPTSQSADQATSVVEGQGDDSVGNKRLVTAMSATETKLIPTATLHAGVVSESFKANVISQQDLVSARTPLGAQFVAAKWNSLTYSWSASQMTCLNTLWSRESHWNYKAKNKRSSAYGIPQANPGSKMASVGSDWRTNPLTQIKWGMSYVKSRYGTPCSALKKSNRSGWY